MSKVTKIKIKQPDGSFSEVNLGAKAENIVLANGKNLETKVGEIDNSINTINSAGYITQAKLEELGYLKAEQVASQEEAIQKSQENPTILYYWDDGNGGIATQVNADWNATSGVAQILNKPTLAAVATSGSYNDLSNKPTIPTVGKLITNVTTAQTVSSGESMGSNITLHKVAKTGSYNDLLNKPTIPSTSDCVKTSGNQTIAGTKTFSTIPVLPGSNPTSDNQAVRKAYADTKLTAYKAADEASAKTYSASHPNVLVYWV